MRWTTNGAKLLSEDTGHSIEEVMALASDVGQVVKCGSVVIADLSGVEPGGNGSPGVGLPTIPNCPFYVPKPFP